jgi:K+-transporting ATPase ATPase C chain
MQKLITVVRAFIVFAILFGVVYPLFVLGVGNLIFPYQAQGSLLSYHDKVVGSELIAQEFSAHKYFHSRFSAVNYNAINSGGSNLAPSNKKLIERAANHVRHIRVENNLSTQAKLPADMVLDSASGLDPHVSLTNALLQLPRVAKHRNLPEDKIKRLIYSNVKSDFIGIWGQAGVNVLQLNLVLDQFNELKR